MEIEAKLRVPDAGTLRRLQSLERLAGYDLHVGQTHAVHDTYLDSADRRMLAAGFACRLRRQGETACITLKGLGGADGALHRRMEQEMQVARDAALRPDAWPDGPLRRQVLDWTGGAPLAALLELRQTRTQRTVSREGLAVATLSLDHVRVAAGGRSDEYWELEVELLPAGREADLQAVLAVLQQEWRLQPEPRSKFERGLELLQGRGTQDERRRPQVLCLGEALFDLFGSPLGVPLRQVTAFIPAPGGAPANVAVGLARLGASAGMIGRVGDDGFGHALIELLQSEGVDTRHLRATGKAPTTLAFVASASPTEQGFLIIRGADAALRPEDVERGYLASARFLVYGSVTLSAACKRAAQRAVEWATQDGVGVVFDANLRPALWPSLAAAKQGILQGVRSADVCKLNERELELLTGTSDPSQGSARILTLGPRLCVVTLGKDGSYFNNGQFQGYMPAFDVQVVDTTGCGDAFLAGLVLGLLEGCCPPECLDERTLRNMLTFANAAGALTATKRGAISALPTRPEVEALLSDRPAA